MASKHLKQPNKPPKEESSKGAESTKGAKHAKPSKPPKKTRPPKKAKTAASGKKAKTGPEAEQSQEQVISLTDALTAQLEASLAQKKAGGAQAGDGDGKKAKKAGKPDKKAGTADRPAPKKADAVPEQAPAPKHQKQEQEDLSGAEKKDGKKKRVVFRRDKTQEKNDKNKPMLSHRDAVGAIIALVAALVLLAASAVIWFYRDSFSPDGMILSANTAAVAQEEYVFDAGSGEAFAAAGQGLAVANTSGFELLDGNGDPVTSMVMQMENPAAAGCDRFAVFYDLGGRRLAVARFDGTVEEIDMEGNILSATVSEGGYIAVTTEQTGYRALVKVYSPELDEVYEWYSSSSWVISAIVSPDSRKLAVLGYTASGSEVRFFRLNEEEQVSAYVVESTVLLDVHWFTSDALCALSSEQILFFDANGQWKNTYPFDGQYLVGYTFDGSNCVSFALSPYRAGTTATLVSLDPNGEQLGTADVQSEIVCLTSSDLEIMVLCSDGAVLYTSSLAEKGRLNGLPGFKYGLLRNRGEALLIAANYAEVYTF